MYFFFKKKTYSDNPLKTDIHSHLLAGLDDGAKNWNETLEIIGQLNQYGFSRVITTPHIMSDLYPNKAEQILKKTAELKTLLSQHNIEVSIEAAAEYYLDENFYTQLLDKSPLLTIGDRYLLFETNFLIEPYLLKDFIFQASAQGYKLIMAHPERYRYMTIEKAEDLRHRGVLFQINLLSISGFYAKLIQKMAHQFIEKGWVELLGSDCHNIVQASALADTMNHKFFHKALNLPLLNYSI